MAQAATPDRNNEARQLCLVMTWVAAIGLGSTLSLALFGATGCGTGSQSATDATSSAVGTQSFSTSAQATSASETATSSASSGAEVDSSSSALGPSTPDMTVAPTATAAMASTETSVDASQTIGVSASSAPEPPDNTDAGQTSEGADADAPACLEFGEPVMIGSFANSGLNGPSGLVASRVHPGVLFAVLDTGGPAAIYAASTTGADLGQYRLDGLEQTDWEDIAVGAGPDGGNFIFIADIGDNAASGMGGGMARDEIQVFRVAEPEVSAEQQPVDETVAYETLRFTYPEGAQNAESLFIDPLTHDLFIVTKTSDEAIVYRASGATPVDTPTVLEEVARAQVGTSIPAAGDISPSGDRILLRTYDSLLIWNRPMFASVGEALAAEPKSLAVADEPRSEGVTFSADGNAWFSAGEESRSLYTATMTCP